MIGLNGIQIDEKVGDLDVIYNGSVFSYDENHPVVISIDRLLTINIEFKQDSSKEIAAINFNGTGHQLNIICYNFSNLLGEGTQSPIKIGELNSRELWITFLVTSYNSSSHLLHYALYYGKTIQSKK